MINSGSEVSVKLKLKINHLQLLVIGNNLLKEGTSGIQRWWWYWGLFTPKPSEADLLCRQRVSDIWWPGPDMCYLFLKGCQSYWMEIYNRNRSLHPMQLITHALNKSLSQAPEATKQNSDGFTSLPLLMYSKTHLDITNSIKNLETQPSYFPPCLFGDYILR